MCVFGITGSASETEAVSSTAIDTNLIVNTWINPANGNYIEFKEGSQSSSDGTLSGSTDVTPADYTINGWSNYNYSISGDMLTLGEETYQMTEENGKLYLIGQNTDTTYMRRDDFFKFEDIEVHHLGDKVSTDIMEYTLTGFGYADEVDPEALGGNVVLFHKDMFVPDNGMIWADLNYNLFCLSNQTVSLHCVDNNVRMTVVYRNSFAFGSDRYTFNYITKGYGGDGHVEYLGSSSDHLQISPLVSEDFETWLPVAPAVRDDASSPHHVMVILPASKGTQLFVYDVTGGAAAPAEADARFSEETAAVEDAAAETAPAEDVAAEGSAQEETDPQETERNTEPELNPADFTVLEVGSSGDDVVKLQQGLQVLGHLRGSADGAYGNGTAGAVSAFQASEGLEQTGIADGETQAKLFSKASVLMSFGTAPCRSANIMDLSLEEWIQDSTSRAMLLLCMELNIITEEIMEAEEFSFNGFFVGSNSERRYLDAVILRREGGFVIFRYWPEEQTATYAYTAEDIDPEDFMRDQVANGTIDEYDTVSKETYMDVFNSIR